MDGGMTDLAIVPLLQEEARSLTDTIRASLEDVRDLIVRAYQGRVWIPLDYDSWDAWVSGEFSNIPLALPREKRREAVASLREQGLSLRAIAAVTGRDVSTVHKDVTGVGNPTPERTTGIDGKSYSSRVTVTERAECPMTEDDVLLVQRRGYKTCPCCKGKGEVPGDWEDMR